MSERISNKKQNFDGIDPQESLIKSLESIKSLLKQGDSKINEARENIARADSSIGNEIKKSDLTKKTAENPDTTFTNPNQTAVKSENSITQDLDDIMTVEEIVVEALPEYTIFNSNHTKSAITKPVTAKTEKAVKLDDTPLKELYENDLIVPMLDEIVIPEDQDSSLFNMDSSIEIKSDSKLTSDLLKLGNTKKFNKNNEKIESNTNTSVKNKVVNSPSDSAGKTAANSKADVISFELNTNKNNLKKTDNQIISAEKPEIKISRQQKNITLIDDNKIEPQLNIQDNIKNESSTEHVIIKETTLDITQLKADSAITTNKPEEIKNKTIKKPVRPKANTSKTDLSSAIDSSSYTDNILSSITKTNNDKTKEITAVQNTDDEIDFSKFEGLDRLKFNADKMSSLQKRVEKRVHNRLIQLIVQLDDEIKNIFTDEIKNCIAHETGSDNNNK